ncbi:GspE/PulE family protein [Candidatus Parcubacteria bacterium]|nr:GspE/PulE family protein [Candidatus Parcubacteria bacterium]
MLSKDQQFKILQLLKDRNFLTDENYQNLKGSVQKGEDVLRKIREVKKVDSQNLGKILAEFFNLPYQDLKSLKSDPQVINLVSEDLARNYNLVVFDKQENVLNVAITDPTDLKAQEAMDYIARGKNLKVKYYLTSPEDLNIFLNQYSALKTEVGEALVEAKDRLEEKETKSVKEENLDEAIKSAPVAKMVSVILKHAVDGYASDVHIEPFSDGSRVRYRIDGVMRTSLILPKYIHTALVSRIKVLANLKIDETRIPQDGRIRLNILNKKIDFRISTLPLYEQEKVVMRILDTSGGSLDLEGLGFEGRNLRTIKDNIHKPHGMFLVTGPTGSGKSTTLYSVLNILNQEEVNIVTLEDPVEYYLTGINQSQIRPEVGLTFATGLRSILRQDPDIIMVGEIRDSETAELAIHASLTGHFVLSTLHTNDALGAIPRLTDMKVEPFLLASTLNVVIAQRLVRKICIDCKEEFALPSNILAEVQEEIKKIPKGSLPEELKNLKKLKFYKGKGCAHCDKTGYKGRIGIAEVLEATDNLKNLIAAGKMGGAEMKQEFVNQGAMTIKEDGMLKAVKGVTTVEEIMRATRE